MTVQLYPSAARPERYRVQERGLNEWVYFSPSTYGSMAKAKKAAEKYQAKLDRRLMYKAKRKELDINKLFRPDGTVKGLTLTL